MTMALLRLLRAAKYWRRFPLLELNRTIDPNGSIISPSMKRGAWFDNGWHGEPTGGN
jgi:hypothetical protein